MAIPAVSRSTFCSTLALTVLGASFAMSGAVPAPEPGKATLVIGEILAQNAESLTSYKAAGTASASNDVRPIAIQRGVGADGAQLASGAWSMALGASSSGSNWRGSTSLNGVDLRTGSYSPSERDISLPSDGIAVGVGRSYNAQQSDGTSRVDSAGLQGNNWSQAGFPEVLLWEHATDDAKDITYLTFGADRFVGNRRFTPTSFTP